VWRIASVAAIAIAIAGCPRRGADADAQAHAHANADANADADADADADAGADADADAGAVADAEDLFTSPTPKSARSIGHTSVVFKIELANGRKAAFKPASRRGPLRYKGEIAAFRLSRALGLSNVPPAYFRTFEAKALAAAMSNEDSAALFAKEAIVKDGLVKGAIVPWIDGLQFVALEQAPLSGQWKAWLAKDGAIPEAEADRAREISNLIVFDFLSGNWDRWSGGNVGLDPKTKHLLYIDNDGAFFDVPPMDGLARNKKMLDGVAKISRSLFDRLDGLGEEGLRKALGEETPGVPLLGPKAFVRAKKDALVFP
jgi:hypothetical protein